MPKFLTNAQVQQYHEEGYLSPIDLMSESDAASVLAQLEEDIILDVVEDLIGTDFSLWGSVLFVKEPASKHFVSWHQDATYMGMTSNDFVTPWIALSPSNRETGCMSMILGSHKNAIRQHDDTYGKDNILTRGQVVKDVDESKAVDLILKPGQMSVHHGEIVHGSQPNMSQQRRVGFALQSYMPNNIKQHIGDNMWLSVRGNERAGEGTTLLSRPLANMSTESVQQREICATGYFTELTANY